MFEKLRKRYLMLSCLILAGIILLVMLSVYYLTSGTIMSQTHQITNYILENDGELRYERDAFAKEGNLLTPFSREILYETRYFSVWLDTDDNIIKVNINSIASIDDENVGDFVNYILKKNRARGRYIMSYDAVYYYDSKELSDGNTLYVFVDCTSRYSTVRQVIFFVGVVWSCVLLLYFILMRYYSRKIIAPFIENDERQKRFITNASHELKTPLAVISANTEMTEALSGTNKWTESTKRQIRRLQSLIEELVVLTRLEEVNRVEITELDYSVLVKETVMPYKNILTGSGRSFHCDLPEGVRVRAEKRGITEVVTILMDNAVKYCDENGAVAVTLEKKGFGISARLIISNTYREGKGQNFSRFFERFYREDASHNSQKEGFGIGLSMARELLAHMHGTIRADYEGDTISFIVDI